MNQSNPKIVYKGHPSYLTNISDGFIALIVILAGTFVFHKGWISNNIFSGWVVAPLIWLAWRLLVTACTSIKITTDRLSYRTGVLNVVNNDTPLYRINDKVVTRSVLQRPFGIATISFITSDRTHPTIEAAWISISDEQIAQIEQAIDASRRANTVRPAEISSQDAGVAIGDPL